MKISKYFFTLLLGIALLVTQAGSALAAPALQDGGIEGTVTALECGTDTEGNTNILVTYEETPDAPVEFDLGTAESLGLVTLDNEGNPICTEEAFQANIDTLYADEEEPQHPVGAVLALFFSDYADYDAIMEAHENGTGFGVITQALWMTMQMEGNSDLFTEILTAKVSGDYSNFVLEDGSTPQNWGQLKKALLNKDEKNNLGNVMSDKDNDELKTNNGNGPDKDKSNNGKGPDKNKDKGKDKDKKKD